MIDVSIRQTGLIVADQGNAVFAGNIFRGNHYEFGPVELRVKGDFLDYAARNLAAHGRAIEHSWQAHVVDVSCRAGDLVAALLARDRLADCVLGGHARISRPLGSPQNFPPLNTGCPRKYVAFTTPLSFSPRYGDMG